MRGKFLVFILILNLAGGSYLGYLLTVTPEAVVPQEFINLAVNQQIEASSILSEQVLKQLEKFETQAIGTSAMLQEIILNRSYIPDMTSYYHDRTAIVQLGLSNLPADPFDSEKYNGAEISLDASAYKIVPSTFNEDYINTYLENEFELLDPLDQIPDDVKNEILETAKLDHVLPALYGLDPSTIWIEYTSEKGYSHSYPWSEVAKSYDGRSESWYSSAATGAKDVIILLDKSGSMEGERKTGAVNATKNIIQNLGGRDRFNIITFSDETSSYTDALSLVSEQNLEDASRFLDTLVTGGTTNYDAAFTAGLDTLTQFGSSRRTPVVVFITDGAPTVGTQDNVTLIENILKENGPVGAQFVFFGISGETDHQLLEEMAIATNGANIRINTTAQIQTAISNYQDFLSLNKQASLTWGLPYIDTNGQGLVVTTSIPVIVNSILRGVVSVDLSLQTLVEFIEKEPLSPFSYSYIFDLAGNNIVHPNVDLNTSSTDAIRQPITQLETDNIVFQEMIKLAQIDQESTQIINYAGNDKIVSLTPIGNTSMVLGMTTPLSDLIPDEVEAKLNELSINTLAFVPGIGLGLIGIMVILSLRKRITKDEIFIPEESKEVATQEEST